MGLFGGLLRFSTRKLFAVFELSTIIPLVHTTLASLTKECAVILIGSARKCLCKKLSVA
jgi:hypothetical protein